MRLLVAVDLSEATARVTEFAQQVAAATRSEVWIVHVAPPNPEFVGYETGPAVVRDQVAHQHREHHRELQAHADELRASGVETTALLVQGSTAHTILGECERLTIDVIVMGTHGRSALAELIMGSVSHAVVRNSRIPVLLVPTRATAAG